MATSGGELMSKSASEIWDFFQRQADNSQQRSQSLKNIKKIEGVNEIHIGESTSEIKEVKKIVEGLSRQIASLTAAKSTVPHDHDSYPDQANAIGVMRKPSNYNLTPTHIILNGETILIFHGLKDSNRMDQQLQLHHATNSSSSSSLSATI